LFDFGKVSLSVSASLVIRILFRIEEKKVDRRLSEILNIQNCFEVSIGSIGCNSHNLTNVMIYVWMTSAVNSPILKYLIQDPKSSIHFSFFTCFASAYWKLAASLNESMNNIFNQQSQGKIY
jgi:hypothetical protein